jgi:hypothetical protein
MATLRELYSVAEVLAACLPLLRSPHLGLRGADAARILNRLQQLGAFGAGVRRREQHEASEGGGVTLWGRGVGEAAGESDELDEVVRGCEAALVRDMTHALALRALARNPKVKHGIGVSQVKLSRLRTSQTLCM